MNPQIIVLWICIEKLEKKNVEELLVLMILADSKDTVIP